MPNSNDANQSIDQIRNGGAQFDQIRNVGGKETTMFRKEQRSASTDFPPLGDSSAERLLQARFRFYDRSAVVARRSDLGLGLAQLVCALLVTTSATFHAPVWYAPALGAVLALLEGIRQLFHVHDNYVSFRAVAEALRTEGWMHKEGAGVYVDAPNPHRLLVERILTISGRENDAWAAAMQETRRTDRQSK